MSGLSSEEFAMLEAAMRSPSGPERDAALSRVVSHITDRLPPGDELDYAVDELEREVARVIDDAQRG
jgi:hypothetical protein